MNNGNVRKGRNGGRCECSGEGNIRYYKEVVRCIAGNSLMLSNVRWCGMVVLIRMLLMVCNSMRKDLGNTSKNDRLFVGSRATVYIRITFIIEELPFLHFLLIVLYSTKMYGLGCHLDPLVLFLDMNFEFELKSDYTIVTNFVYV